MAIAGVGSLSASLADGLARQGQVILGGDLSFTLIQREAAPAEREFFDGTGTVSAVATLRAMARAADGKAALVEMKAVDGAYPLFGQVSARSCPARSLPRSHKATALSALSRTRLLLTRLGLKPGARLTIGDATFEIRAALASEPDKLAGGIGFGPRLLVSEAGLRATGLLQPGSLVRWHYRLRLPANDTSDAAAKAVAAQARAQFPEAGWDIRTSFQRLAAARTQRRALHPISHHRRPDRAAGRRRRRRQCGEKPSRTPARNHRHAEGARRDRPRASSPSISSRCMMLAAIGGVIGVALGAVLPFAIVWTFGAIIPLPIEPALHPGELALALVYGLITALAFALWPLGRAHDVPVGALFRDAVAPQPRWPRQVYIALTAAAAAALVTLAVALAYDRHVAIVYVAIAAGVFVALAARRHAADAGRTPGAARALDRVAHGHRQYPPAGRADADDRAVARPRHRAAGHGDRDRRQSAPAIRRRTAGQGAVVLFPRYPAADAARFDAFVREAGARRQARGRADAARPHRLRQRHPGRKDQAEAKAPPGCCKATAASPMRARCPRARGWSRANGGAPDYDGPPLLSFEKKIADGLGLKLGDEVTVNVLGRNITARDRQYAHGRLAEPRHQFRAWCFRRTLSTARRTPISPR